MAQGDFGRSISPDFRFYLSWKALAKQGVCDEPGGAEFERVRAEWYTAGCPGPIGVFIRERANIGPEGK